MKNKGISPIVALLSMLLIVGAIGAFAWMYTLAIRPPVVPVVEHDGEWSKIYAPDDVAGTDLTITETTITDGGTFRVANMSYDLNGTDGQTAYMAFGIKIKGTNGFENMDIDGELGADASTSEIKIRKAYILLDEEGIDLDPADARYTGTVNTDQDEFEFDINYPVPEDEYVLCVEVKGIATITIDADDEVLKIEFDGKTTEDVDDFTAYVHNA